MNRQQKRQLLKEVQKEISQARHGTLPMAKAAHLKSKIETLRKEGLLPDAPKKHVIVRFADFIKTIGRKPVGYSLRS